MKIAFYRKRFNSVKESAIYARISYQNFSFNYYISESIKKDFWDTNTQRGTTTKEKDKAFKEHREFNYRLDNIESTIKNEFRKFQNDNEQQVPEPSDFKILLDKAIKKQVPESEVKKTFFGFFEEIIRLSKSGGRVQPINGKPYGKETINKYNTVLNRLKEFQNKRKRKIDFKTIDLDFYTDFKEYLNKQNLMENTVGNQIKTIKAILGEATERGINTNLAYKSRRFSTTTEKSDDIYLTVHELEEMKNLDLSSIPRLDNVRDLFIIGCYTGLRISDLSQLTIEKFKTGMIEIKEQQKTQKPVTIPIHNEVKKIITKYGENLPKSISDQKTNLYLKEIGRMMPSLHEDFEKTITKGGMRVITTIKRWEALKNHTSRRTFATNQFLAGTPTLTIMAITGHKTEKSFLLYIKLTNKDHAIELGKRWAAENNLKAV